MSSTLLSDNQRFSNLTFADFQRMAVDPSLSCHEKVGFPNSLRADSENIIFNDILSKLTNLQNENKTVLEVGPGCGPLPVKLIELCREKHHKLILIDSAEMLEQLPNAPFITKIPALYPTACKEFIAQFQYQVDVVLAYSVLQIVFTEGNVFEFLDDSLSLLQEGGQCLIGDIPNVSKRKRFLSSSQGVKHHQQYYDANGLPKVEHLQLESKLMDDGVLFGMLMRYRHAGFDAYLLPQSVNLPMANRREDMLICRA